ncbi:MAG: signal peptidase I [Ruminococcus sp.]|nr:signal peptidase I [Ruminococcus sp.]
MDEEKIELLNKLMKDDEDSEFSESSKIQIESNDSKGMSILYDWVQCILIAFIAVAILLTFAFRVINVDGDSMMNTLFNADKVVVSQLFYTPKEGDVVVISHGAQFQKPIIKRVIATAGQTLDINFETGEVVVDGIVINEDYIIGETRKGNAEIPNVIPEGKVFVMGDNRSVSLDSRFEEIGLINETDIIGKAEFVFFPFEHFGFVG